LSKFVLAISFPLSIIDVGFSYLGVYISKDPLMSLTRCGMIVP
jgi:hypothetical protein